MEWQAATFSGIDWHYGEEGSQNTTSKYEFFKVLLVFVISECKFVARCFRRGLQRAMCKFDSGNGVVLAKLQKAQRNENRNELAATNVCFCERELERKREGKLLAPTRLGL